ncbi:Zn-dependent hydrolase [Virgibacillus doumboii]|uniref:Zn-dependent hydrolase n=1 Tax=Virgibacillus doumboii TaxID=2697503 RepID=UPI0019688CE7|nr:Zn-dependent hydrolase [Virgibacillus doumboii]
MSPIHEINIFKELMQDYDRNLDHSGINGDRIAKRLYELSQIGMTADGGVMRPGFSGEEKDAKQLVKGWMREAGLEVSEDGAGNVIGRMNGINNDVPAIASGSHVDSVPNGGHFDGPVGVLAALEVVAAWKETNYSVKKPYEVIVFSDEEGSRFNSGLTGSMAMTGEADFNENKDLIDYDGKSFENVLRAYGSDPQKFQESKRDLKEIETFAEVHIEQGKKLEKENLPVGIVSGIAGPAWLQVTFIGQAGHAGNTPMIGRKDPMVAAAAFVQRIESFPGKVSDSSVATVGKVNVYPNGINVIPEKVELSVDARDIHEHTRDELLEMIVQEAESIAENRGITCDINPTTKIKPIPIKKELQDKLAAAVLKNDIKPSYVPSGAGHDAMILGRHIPVAMLFVRSKDGISHNPKEWSSLNDIVSAIHVLKDYVETLMAD